MHCKYCGFANGGDDHRCLRCGRRIGAAAFSAVSSGANALAVVPAFETCDTQDFEPLPGSPLQPRLFQAPARKVIAFDEIGRRTGAIAETKPASAPRVRRTSSHVSGPAPEQTTIDFVPGAALPARVLKTEVPAQIYCEQRVATPTHRCAASLIDAAMIVLGFGLFAAAVELTGGSFGTGRAFWLTAISAALLLSVFYGLIWAIGGRETAGMNWTDLQLITFDGFPVDGRSRASRVASTWLSFCSGGLGLIWAVADEENLTWHDHISKTFPTVRPSQTSFVRQRH